MTHLPVYFRHIVVCLSVLVSCLTAGCSSTYRDSTGECVSESKDVTAALGDSIRFMGGEVLPNEPIKSSTCKGLRIVTRNNLDHECIDEPNWQTGMGQVFKAARSRSSAEANSAARYLICRMKDPNAAIPSLYWSTADECRLLSAKLRGTRLELLFAHIQSKGLLGGAPAPLDLYMSLDRRSVAALGVTIVEASFVTLRLGERGRVTLFDLSHDKEIAPIVIFFENN